jgi:hypothetical protein
MVTKQPNPYQTPDAVDRDVTTERSRRSKSVRSVVMILVGAFFCASSLHVVLGHGLQSFLHAYRTLGCFSVGFVMFYGFAGGLMSLLHFTYLVRGWPKQHLAGIYAILVGLCLTGIAVAILEVIA